MSPLLTGGIMEESKNEQQQSNEFERKFFQHYMWSILWSYIALCVIAVVGYFVFECWFELVKADDKPTKIAIIVGLITWTAAMIVPIAAGFAMKEWRIQEKAKMGAEFTKQVILLYSSTLSDYDKFVSETDALIIRHSGQSRNYVKSIQLLDQINTQLIEFHNYSFKRLESNCLMLKKLGFSSNIKNDCEIKVYFRNFRKNKINLENKICEYKKTLSENMKNCKKIECSMEQLRTDYFSEMNKCFKNYEDNYIHKISIFLKYEK